VHSASATPAEFYRRGGFTSARSELVDQSHGGRVVNFEELQVGPEIRETLGY